MMRSRWPCSVRNSSAPSSSSDSARPRTRGRRGGWTTLRPRVVQCASHSSASAANWPARAARNRWSSSRRMATASFGAGDGSSPVDLERGGDLAQLGREIAGRQVHIHADAEDDIADAVQFGAQFGQDAGDLFAPDQNVVGPFDLRLQAGLRSEWRGAGPWRRRRSVGWLPAGAGRAGAGRKTKSLARRAKSTCAPAGPGPWSAIRRRPPRLPSRRRGRVSRRRRWWKWFPGTRGCRGR